MCTRQWGSARGSMLDGLGGTTSRFPQPPEHRDPAWSRGLGQKVIDLEGHIEIRESPAKPGDYVVLRALEDLVVVVTACSVDRGVLNGGEPKELLLEVYE